MGGGAARRMNHFLNSSVDPMEEVVAEERRASRHQLGRSAREHEELLREIHGGLEGVGGTGGVFDGGFSRDAKGTDRSQLGATSFPSSFSSSFSSASSMSTAVPEAAAKSMFPARSGRAGDSGHGPSPGGHMRGNIGNSGTGNYGGIPSDTSSGGKQSTVDRAKISAWKSKYTKHE